MKGGKDKYSKINTNYDSAATYSDLMKVIENRGLNPDIVKDIVEHQEYKAQNKLYELAKENISSFVSGTVASFMFGAGVKYFGDGNLMHPLIFATGVTAILDVYEYIKEKDIKPAVRNDVGSVAGNTLGLTLASLL